MTSLNSARPTLLRALLAALVAALVLALPMSLGGSPVHASDGTTPSVTPTPGVDPAAEVATVVYSLGDRTLRYGDTGPDVLALQKLLAVKKTGRFNKATRQAVRKVQRAAGITDHGRVGARTLKAVKKAAAARKRAAKLASRSLPRAGSPVASQAYARVYIARKYGWTGSQMSCLVTLWNRESGWRYTASNPNGRYHGIPQTSAGVWQAAGYTTAQYMRSPEVQIKVGTRYIKSRYGTPCRALSFWNSHHWY